MLMKSELHCHLSARLQGGMAYPNRRSGAFETESVGQMSFVLREMVTDERRRRPQGSGSDPRRAFTERRTPTHEASSVEPMHREELFEPPSPIVLDLLDTHGSGAGTEEAVRTLRVALMQTILVLMAMMLIVMANR